MQTMLIVKLMLAAAAAATGALAYDNLGLNYNSLGCGFPGLDPLGGFGSFGLGVPGVVAGVPSAEREDEGRVLSCQQTGKGVAFVINIGKRQARKKKLGFGAGPFLGASSFLLPHSAGLGFGSPFPGAGGRGAQGLNATIDIDTSRGDLFEMGLLVVEEGFTANAYCNAKEFTAGVSPASREKAGLFGGHLGAQLGGYGAQLGGYGAQLGGFGTYGLGAPLGFAASPLTGFGFPQHFAFSSKKGQGRQQEVQEADGLLTILNLEGQNVQQRSSIFLEKLNGYKSLKELAGRSVIACGKPGINNRGQAFCDGEVFACCTLGYDTTVRQLVTGYE